MPRGVVVVTEKSVMRLVWRPDGDDSDVIVDAFNSNGYCTHIFPFGPVKEEDIADIDRIGVRRLGVCPKTKRRAIDDDFDFEGHVMRFMGDLQRAGIWSYT